MDLTNASAAVTGGASGLGRATAEAFIARGVSTVIIDLPSSDGDTVAKRMSHLASFLKQVNAAASWRKAAKCSPWRS